jgi:hypothetical protein
MLTGSEVQRARKLHSLPSWANNAAGVRERAKPHMSSERNRVSPYCSREGRKAARLDDSGAGRGGESKRMPPGNRMDTGSCGLARKRADFSLVFDHERT